MKALDSIWEISGKVNPGGKCTLNPFDDNTYVLAAGHAAIALDGTRMSGTTGTARSLFC